MERTDETRSFVTQKARVRFSVDGGRLRPTMVSRCHARVLIGAEIRVTCALVINHQVIRF
jgi:hypothetical protein